MPNPKNYPSVTERERAKRETDLAALSRLRPARAVHQPTPAHPAVDLYRATKEEWAKKGRLVEGGSSGRRPLVSTESRCVPRVAV